MAEPRRRWPDQPATLIATWFGCGMLPGAPGTWGSLAALPFAWAIVRTGGPPALLAAATALFLLGWWAAGATARALGLKDPGVIVVDEVVGQWLTLVVAPFDPVGWAAGFVLFRLFDIVKPWPVRWADRRVPGGLGIMLDDALAALYAAAVLVIGRVILGR
jgi:phosphatidylglycerophosphatase A